MILPPFDADRWLAGTSGMPALQIAVYIQLVARMYTRSAPIPEEPETQFRLCGLSNRKQFTDALAALIQRGNIVRLADGQLWNGKVDQLVTKIKDKSAKASEAARQRWAKVREPTQSSKLSDRSVQKSNENNDTQIEMQYVVNACGIETPSPKKVSPIPPSKNHPSPRSSPNGEDRNSAGARATVPESEKAGKQDTDGFRRALSPLCLDSELIDSMVITRRNKRAPLTPKTGRNVAEALMATPNAEVAANEMVNRGWLMPGQWYHQRDGTAGKQPQRKSMLDEHVEEMRRKYGHGSGPVADIKFSDFLPQAVGE